MKKQPARQFIRSASSSEEYVQNIVSYILMEGACSVCFRCKVLEGFEQECAFCGETKPQTDFATRSDTSAKWRCKECANPPCVNPECATCKLCRNPSCKKPAACSKPREPYPDCLLPKTVAEMREFRCLGCREWRCVRCQVSRKQSEFSKSTQKKMHMQWMKEAL